MTRISCMVAACLLASGCSSLPDQYCQVQSECDSFLDSVGESDDSVAVCAVQTQTALDIYRANSEEACHEVAEEYEQYMACVVEEGCDAYEIPDPACSSEFTAWLRALDDAGGRCDD